MKKILGLLALSVIALLAVGCASTGLPQFGAEMGAQPNPVPGGDTIRVPYTDTISYFGYIKPGSAPDATVDGKKMYYLYVWVPLVAPEIGIRMVSPAPADLKPKEGDFVSKLWEEGTKDTTSYFDTWISWERALEVINPEDIATKGSTTKSC